MGIKGLKLVHTSRQDSYRIGMLVQQLTIESFRGIDSLSLTLHPELTVIVGENGVGKTSVLDAIAILLDNYLARWLRGSAQSAERLKDSDIKIGKNTCSVAIKVLHRGLEGEWTLRRQTRQGRIRSHHSSDFSGLNALVRGVTAVDEGRLSGSPLLIYYGQRRAVLELPRRIRLASHQEPEAAFDDALKVGDLNFREFIAWFRDKSLEEAQNWRRDRRYVDIQLDAVRRAMTKATGLNDPSYRVPTPSGLCFTKRGVELRVDQLSSGERGFLSLAGDLARRLAMLNQNGSDPLLGDGVVLIDEVELHLHPNWQRKFLPWMRETFPNCQFIVTTHSPQVLGEIKSENIRILQQISDQIYVSKPGASYGRDSNFLLLSVLGAEDRNVSFPDLMKEFDKYLVQGKLEEAESVLEKFTQLVEGFPPEVTLAYSRLTRLKRLKSS
jgi:predicted ATP-binding protein involved in virulence